MKNVSHKRKVESEDELEVPVKKSKLIFRFAFFIVILNMILVRSFCISLCVKNL